MRHETNQQMEMLTILLDDHREFDRIIADSLLEGGDLRIITKDNATMGGHPAVMLTFSIQLPDGTIKTAQTVTTVRLLLQSVRALQARYGHLL